MSNNNIVPQFGDSANGVLDFVFEGQNVRAGILSNGQPYAIASDIGKVLGIQNIRDAVSRLDDDEKGVVSIYTPGGQQKVTYVNQYGLYALILSSRKPSAKPFKRWVIHELIPAVLEHGGYISPDATEEQIAVLKTQLDYKEQQIRELKQWNENAEYSRRWMSTTYTDRSNPDRD